MGKVKELQMDIQMEIENAIVSGFLTEEKVIEFVKNKFPFLSSKDISHLYKYYMEIL